MKRLDWFEREFTFGLRKEMLPFFLERLEGSIYRIGRVVANRDDALLSERINDKWSVKQQIGHLAEVDTIANKRIDEMINGVPVLSPAVFEPRDYNQLPIEKVFDLFHENRWANISKYKELKESDLTKSSLHPRLKVQMTPVDLAWFDAEHDDHHIMKMKDILIITKSIL